MADEIKSEELVVDACDEFHLQIELDENNKIVLADLNGEKHENIMEIAGKLVMEGFVLFNSMCAGAIVQGAFRQFAENTWHEQQLMQGNYDAKPSIWNRICWHAGSVAIGNVVQMMTARIMRVDDGFHLTIKRAEPKQMSFDYGDLTGGANA